MLSVSLLGNFSIRHDDKPISGINTPRLQSLLAFLILHRNAPQSRAHLAFLFWPDTTETQARTNLRNLLHHLRYALPEADSTLDTNVQTLQWRSNAPLTLDVADFQAALASAEQVHQSGDSAVHRTALEKAIALYNGDLLPSCYDDWIIPLREELRQAYLDTLEQLVRILEEQRDYPGAIHHAQRLLRHDPLQEATYRCLIRLHALNGDRAGALRVYHTCTTTLQRELDVEPGDATREAYQQLLGAGSQPFLTIPATTAFSPLVGRDKEWEQLLQAWQSVTTGGTPHAVILRGEAGIGKTKLMEDLLQWATRQGIASASARCYAAEGNLAYAPVSTWLRAHPLASLEDVWLTEAGRILPEILVQRPDLPRPVALTESWQRQHLFEALSRAILGASQPLLLTIDDLQWCDRDTLEWLHFLLRFDSHARLLVIGSYRPEEIGDSHPLVSALQALYLQGQVTEINLQPLDEADTHLLASSVTGMEIERELAQYLYRETEGNPLFVVETVRIGLPEYANKTPARHRDSPLQGNTELPPKVQSVLEARLAQVSPPTRELAGLAATIGREFDYALLAKASGRDEDTLVRELDELWQRRIVREHGSDSYDFSHDKLREVAYNSMSTARRRLLHRQTAQALERLHSAELDPVSHQVAAHYEHAGLPDKAIPYYLRAAGVERQVFANEGAIALLRRGLSLIEADEEGTSKEECSHEMATQLWEGLGDVLELKAQHAEALQAYQKALARVPGKDRIWQARLNRKVAEVIEEQRHYIEALDAFHRAEVALGEQPGEDANSWWDEWLEVQVRKAFAHYWLAQWPEIEALLNRAQPVVRERGGAANRARFLTASCLMYLRRDRYVVSDEMLANSREALAASLEWGDMKYRIESQFELGFFYLWRRELDEAEKNLLVALEMAETSGNLRMQTLCLTYLTVLSRFRGQVDEVLDYARRAQEVAEAAQMYAYVAAARGNLAWLDWRRRELEAAEQGGQDALVLWRQSPLAYPFQWQALWPLIGVSLARGREVEAWDHFQALLEPMQQRLPEELNAALEGAVQAKSRGKTGAARSLLDHAMELAQAMGYL